MTVKVREEKRAAAATKKDTQKLSSGLPSVTLTPQHTSSKAQQVPSTLTQQQLGVKKQLHPRGQEQSDDYTRHLSQALGLPPPEEAAKRLTEPYS